MKIVTFNIRNSWYGDGKNSFAHRAGMLYSKIREENPDVIAFQEIQQRHIELLEKMFPEYEFHGQFREIDYTGEGVFTAVRRDDWQVVAFESFWISPTPYVPGSRFETQSEYLRICAVVQIRNKVNGKMFRFFNIHLDHASDEARLDGMKCVLEMTDKFNEKSEVPSVILGDFNAHPESKAMKYVGEHAGTKFADVTSTLSVSAHDWGTYFHKIDYILVSGGMEKALTACGIWDEYHDGIYLSDHYPVFADFDLAKM